MMGWLDRLLDVASGLSRVAAWVCGALLLGAAGWMGVEVLVRKLFGISTQGSTEISSYVLAIITSWSLLYTLLRKGHVRVDVVTARLPLKGRSALHLLALLVLALFSVPLAYFGWGVTWASLVNRTTANTALRTPLWIPQGLWMAGLVVFALGVVLLTIKVAVLMLRHEYTSVERLVGLPGEYDANEAVMAADAGAGTQAALESRLGASASGMPGRKETQA